MEVNQINLTSKISIPKGNFDFVMEATHNEQLYLGCLNAERCMMTDYDSCLKGIRRSIEMLGIELEKWSRAETNNISPEEALRSIFLDLKRLKSPKGGKKERRRLSKKNFYIRHVIDFEKRDHEEFTRKQIEEFVDSYSSIYPYSVNEGDIKNDNIKSIAYDMYARCSRPLTDKGCGTKEDCENLVMLFHKLLCLLNYVQEPYDIELTPIEDYYPIPYELYDKLNLIRGSNVKIYVSEDGRTYYMLKRKDIEFLDILDPTVYRERMTELDKLDTLWRRLGGLPGYEPHMGIEVGTHDYRRMVFEFAGRPQAMTQRFIEKLDEKSKREELVRELIRLIRSMHDIEPSMSHKWLNPECIYVCEKRQGLIPYIAGFDNVRPAPVKADYPGRGMLDDYFNSINLQKFIAPEIRNGTNINDADGMKADIYSLGKLIKYIYGRDENRVKDYVEQLIVKDPGSRPTIVDASRLFDDEVVDFEPTVTFNAEIIDEFRLLIYTPFHGFDNYVVKDTVTLGRMFSSEGSDIKVDSPIASRTHGRFVKTGTGFEYMDMLSTNGTFINNVLYGVQRGGRSDTKPVAVGDILKIDHPEFKNTHRNAVFMFVLAPSHHEMIEKSIDIMDGMDISIGRKDCDVILTNNRVSKRHARFVMKDHKLYIQDLNSTNGVFVNGKKIDRPALLHATDNVRIEDYIFIVSGRKILYYAE